MGRKKAYSYDPNNKARGKGRRRGNISTDADATELTGSVTWYAPPTVPEGHQLVVIDGYTMGRTTSANATPQFIILPTSSTELINVVNRIPGIGANATTEAGAYAALASSDACYVASFGDSETTVDGLVLELDASKKISYPSTGNTWYDLSGQNNNASLSNSPTYSTDGYIIFDGTNDYATISSDSSFNVNTRTVELTFKMNGSYSNFAPLAVYANGSSSTNRVWLGLQSSKFRMHGWGTSDPAATTTIDADRWYTCVWSYDKGTQKMKMYTNGVLENDHSQTQGGVNGASGMNWYLAYIPGGWQSQTYSDVSIKSFKVYDKILSDSEVKQNYYDGPIVTDELKLNLDVSNLVSFEDGSTAWYDMVNSNYSASLVGNVDYSTTYNGTLNVDGSQTSDYIILPHQVLDNDISSNGAWSLECWLRMDNTSGTTYFFSTATTSTTNGWIIQKSNGNIYPWNESQQNGSAISFTAGETFHLTLSINGSSIYLYKNGSYIGRYSYTKNIVNATGWVLNQEQDALLGGFDSSQATDMGINIIRVYNKTLSADEVKQNFDAHRSRFGL